jgi:DNA-binding GntR family transcriptional regulator
MAHHGFRKARVMAIQQSRSDAIYASLRRAIIEQALKPGAKLPEDTIGETFGVSRTSVRNALVRLNAEGLVELRPNRGASVARPSLEDAHDIFGMRRCLEREVVTRLCARMSKDGIDALEAHLAEEERALRAGGPRSIRLAGEFHILLAELTGSKTLAGYVGEIVSRCSLILALYGRPHSAECGVEEHARIIAALREQDAQAATAIMETHLDAVRDRARIDAPEPAPDVAAILGAYARADV